MATVQNVVDEVRAIIHDEVVTYRWSDAELIRYINAGARQTVTLVPEANTVEQEIALGTSRIARQVLPTGGIKFLKVSRNLLVGEPSSQEGVVRYVEKDALDTFDPDWEYVTTEVDSTNYFKHYCHDPREPTVFYLYPPPVVDNKAVSVVFSQIPVAMTIVGDTIPLEDEYLNALIQYTVYRALTKESRETLPSEFRDELWQNYLITLGMGRKANEMASPENVRPPEGA